MDASETPPTRIGNRYRLDERIGAGAMGAVWRGTDELLNRPVALKELLAAASRGGGAEGAEEARQRLMREGRIGARLQHAHVISMFDVVVHEERPWLVMEYLPSQSLAQVLSTKGPLEPLAAADVGRQVADGLAAAHAAGVVHRDVKPGNVLLAEDGRVKITDFGVSRAVDDVQLTRTGLIAGTPAFLAPEIARGHEPTAASDVFALGSTLYTAVEGMPPFGLDENAYALLHKVAMGEVNPPQQAGALEPVLMQLLATDPLDRPTASQAREALALVAAGQAPAPAAPAPTRRTSLLAAFGGGGRNGGRNGGRSGTDRPATGRTAGGAALGAGAAAAGAAGGAPTDGPTVAEGGTDSPAPDATAALPPPPTSPPDPAAADGDATDRTERTADAPAEAAPAAPAAPAGSAPAGAAASGARPPRRWPILIAAVLLVALVLGSVLITALSSGGDPGAAPATAAPTGAPAPASTSAEPDPSPDPTTAGPTTETPPTTTSAPPTTTQAPPVTEAPPAVPAAPSDPVGFVQSYYELLPENTEAAWARLSPQAQSLSGGRQGYDGFWADFTNVYARDLRLENGNTVFATIVFMRGADVITQEPYRFVISTDAGGRTIMESFAQL